MSNDINPGTNIILYLYDVASLEQRKRILKKMLEDEVNERINIDNDIRQKESLVVFLNNELMNIEKEECSEKRPQIFSFADFLGGVFYGALIFFLPVAAVLLICGIFDHFNINLFWVGHWIMVFADLLLAPFDPTSPFDSTFGTLIYYLFGLSVPVGIMSLIVSVIFILFMRLMEPSNKTKMESYNKKYNEWEKNKEKRIQQIKDEIKHNQSEIISLNQKINALQGRMPLLKKQMEETEQLLEKYYSLNIIYSKYRNIDPVIKFIDYFQSGRCTKFVGADGAYNMYEHESRLDKIINNLETINNSLVRLSNQLNAISRQINSIEQNVSLGYAEIVTCLNTQAHICSNLLKEQNDANQNIENKLDSIKDLEKLRLEQDRRFYEYQNFVAKQERLESGYWC